MAACGCRYLLRISVKKGPQDNPYYYSNDRLANCLAAMERLRVGGWSAPGPSGEVTVKLLSVAGLAAGYRADCGGDACRVDLNISVSPPVSGDDLEAALRTLAKECDVLINVLRERGA